MHVLAMLNPSATRTQYMKSAGNLTLLAELDNRPQITIRPMNPTRDPAAKVNLPGSGVRSRD